MQLSDYVAQHFQWSVDGALGRVVLNRPERKNPLTFESYAELRDLFRSLGARAVRSRPSSSAAPARTSARAATCTRSSARSRRWTRPGLLAFTRMTGDLVKAMRGCPQPIVAAVDGVCAGAGAIIAMVSDLRVGTARSRISFLFNRVGLAGCDMGACAILPRIIGQGRAAELLYLGRSMSGDEALQWGFFNRLVAPEQLADGGDAARAGNRGRPVVRERHHQDDAEPGMEHEPRAGDRSGSAGAGAVHADGRFPARLPRVPREAEAGLRGQLMSSEFLQPPGWAAPKGYSNGVSARGRQIYLAGQIGWNESQQLVSSRFAVQVRQALQNIMVLLAQAGGRPEHLVRLTWFVTNLDEYRAELKEIGAAYRDVIGRHYPPMSVVQVVALVEQGAKVEIEATAVVPE